MEKKMSKKRITVLCIIAFVILAMLVGVIGYMLGWFNKGYDADVVTVAKRNITATFDTSGKVSSKSEGDFTLVPGVKVNKVNVKVGSSVKKGDVLAEFDASSLNKTLGEKKSALDKAQRAYNDYKSSMDSAKGQLSSINSQLAAAEAKVDALEKKVNGKKNTFSGTEQKNQAQQAKDKLSSLMGDSSLAGKIIDNLVSSSKSLQELKAMLEKISGANEDTIFQILSSMGSMSAGGAQYELAQAQIELASLKISKAAAQTQANGDLEDVYRSIYESAQKGYNSVKSSIDALNSGWVAAEDGIVSEVNITEGETVKEKENLSLNSGFDISSIVKFLDEMRFAFIHLRYFRKMIFVHLLCRQSQSGDSRHILGSGTPSVLLAAPVNDRMHFYAICHIQKSGSFWSVDLMSADRKKINL